MNPKYYAALRNYCTRYGIDWRFDTIQNPITLIWQVLKVVNELVGDMEELQKAMADLIQTIEGTIDVKVVEVLQGWLNDGTLEEIINVGLLNDLNQYINNVDLKVDLKASESIMRDYAHNTKGMKSIAHRGISIEAPENSLAAIMKAQQYGVWGCEVDVRIASDGVPVCYHDADLSIKTNGVGSPESQTSSYLTSLSYKNTVGYANINSPNWVKVITLDTALSNMKHGNLTPVLDLPELLTSTQLTDILNLVRTYDLEKEVIFVTFEMENLRRLKQINPYVKVMLNVSARPSDPVINEMISLGNSGFNFNYSVSLTKEEIKVYHNFGLVVGYWTVNEENVWVHARNGIDYLTSDYGRGGKKVYAQRQVQFRLNGGVLQYGSDGLGNASQMSAIKSVTLGANSVEIEWLRPFDDNVINSIGSFITIQGRKYIAKQETTSNSKIKFLVYEITPTDVIGVDPATVTLVYNISAFGFQLV